MVSTILCTCFTNTSRPILANQFLPQPLNTLLLNTAISMINTHSCIVNRPHVGPKSSSTDLIYLLAG